MSRGTATARFLLLCLSFTQHDTGAEVTLSLDTQISDFISQNSKKLSRCRVISEEAAQNPRHKQAGGGGKKADISLLCIIRHDSLFTFDCNWALILSGTCDLHIFFKSNQEDQIYLH